MAGRRKITPKNPGGEGHSDGEVSVSINHVSYHSLWRMDVIFFDPLRGKQVKCRIL
jgi:hypothetical protein